jgi:hypothetical protein
MTLFAFDTFWVIGKHELEFEDSVHDVYLQGIGSDEGARLAWFFATPHGAGAAYVVVTITAFADGAAWDRARERLWRGDLAKWEIAAEGMCYRRTSSLAVAAEWSPLAELDLATVPTDGREHDPSLVRLDTVPVAGRPGDALDVLRDQAAGQATSGSLLSLRAAWQPAFGALQAREVTLLYSVDGAGLPAAFGRVDPADEWSGTATGLPAASLPRSTQLMRVRPWSPLP